ncbi:hypothetical protein NLX83_13725 [Allokutzneria sp. A3M-2-11 16]|uniref:hypothetical protein n=1 Tax=Allokutzneria sp. A3M-2-11 16 TaxID=2962043 RepID=UPI0020B76AB7|nr:hypothetical protein [Allokutzneria sp. A3M-2-11 16]MCP3800318.1 hypothetical protein [Allokutzneria sp. A3M-2-11 16]
MAFPCAHGSGCAAVQRGGYGGAGPGKPLTVARLLAREDTASALEADFLRWFGVDLLDLYRGRLSLRRVCLLVQHLPIEAAVWRTEDAPGPWSRTEALLFAVERRVTALWATVSAAFGAELGSEQLEPPIAVPGSEPAAVVDQAEVMPLREIARWMRGT